MVAHVVAIFTAFYTFLQRTRAGRGLNETCFNVQMELLDIRSNSVGEEGARRLALAMHNVRRLGLSSCEIDVDALRLLTDGLQRLAAPVNWVAAVCSIIQFGIESISGFPL